jgi:ribosomal protein S27AE
MDIGSLFLILALVVLVSLFISRPFFEPRRDQPTPAGEMTIELEHKRSALLAEYDQALNSIQELDFDHDLGKIPEGEFPLQRMSLLQDAARLLDQLDAFQGAASPATVEDRIETAINSRRANPPSENQAETPSEADAASDVDDQEKDDTAIETLIAIRRGAQPTRAGGFCPHCGRPVQKDDNFCPRCGASLLLYEKS